MKGWVKPNCFALLRKELVYAYKNGWNYLNDPLSAHFNYIDGRITRGQYFMSTCCLLWGQFFKFLLLDSYINLWVKFHFQIHKGKFVGHGRLLFIVRFCVVVFILILFYFFLFLSLFTSKMECFCFIYNIHLYIIFYIYIYTYIWKNCVAICL